MVSTTKKALKIINPLGSDGVSTLLMGDSYGKPREIGAKDTEYTDFRQTLPITDAESRIDRIRKNTGEAKDAILGGFWESVKGGAQTVYDVYNYGTRGVPTQIKEERAREAKFALDKVNKDSELQIQYEKALANRRPVETVRAEIAQVIAAAQKKEDNNPGSVNQNQLEAQILSFAKSQGYSAQEVQGGGDVDVDLLPDPYGLATDTPNPFPEAENAMKLTGGIGGNILGYNMSKHWAIAQPGMLGKGAQAFGKGVKGGFQFWKGGPYWGRMAGALAGGLVGVLTADFGYEAGLDIANQAGVFGKKGINRPGIAPRVRSLIDTAEQEVKLTALGGFVAPSINAVRNLTRSFVFGAGKQQTKIAEKGMELAEKYIPEGQYGGKKGWNKIKGESESIVGITDVSSYRSVQGIPNVGGRFPLIGGGITKNLSQRAEKMNVILNNMNDRIAPSVSYNKLSEAVSAASKVSAGKISGELTKLRKEWFGHAISRGANVKLAGNLGDTSAHSIITDFKAHMAQTTGKGIDGTPLPSVVRNRLDTFFDNILKEPGSVTLARADSMLDELGQVMRMGGMKNNPTAINFAEQFSQSVQNSMRMIDLGEAGKSALKRYDDLWTQGQMLLGKVGGPATPVAKQLGLSPNMLYGYQHQLANQGTKYADDLLHTAKLLESPKSMQNLQVLVGDDIFRGMIRRHIESSYKSALKEWPGKSFLDLNLPIGGKALNNEGVVAAKQIDPKKFIENLGLNDQGGKLFATISEGLKMAQKGIGKNNMQPWMKSLPSELIDAGADPKTIQILNGRARQVDTGFVTAEDLTNFAIVLEAGFRGGVPDISTFIARRAQLAGLQGAIRSFLPGKTIGGSATAGGIAPAVSMIYAVAFSLLARQGGKILTNPINLKAVNQILKATDEDIARIWNPFTYHKYGSAPKALAVKNALETIGANFNGELEEFQLQTQDALNSQRKRDQINSYKEPEATGQEVLQEKMNIFDKMKQAAQAKQGIREESLAPPVTDVTENISVASSSPMSASTSTGNTFGGGATGSSIGGSATMNPGAAASLYSGNTDAALANQFGTPTSGANQMPRRAATGGIISLVS